MPYMKCLVNFTPFPSHPKARFRFYLGFVRTYTSNSR